MVDNYARMTENYNKINKAVSELAEQSFQIDTSPFKVNNHILPVLLFDWKFPGDLIVQVGVCFAIQ